jgi:hypothetical protein
MGRALTDEELAALADWYIERRCSARPMLCIHTIEDFATCIGVEMTPYNCIDLFHYIIQRSNES